MNNYEFYSNLQKYQDNDIEHGLGTKIANGLNSAYNWAKEKVTGKSDFQPTYYQKIDNAYGPGKARYFYSKEEWDAYQRELAGYRQKADQDVAKRDAQIQQQQQMQKQNYTNNRRAAEQAGAQRAFNESSRGKLYNQSQSGREAAMRKSQQVIQQQQSSMRANKDNYANSVRQNINNHAEEERARKMKENAQNEVDAQRHAQAENYRKNMQAAQSMNNAEAQRAQKTKENAANEVQAQKDQKAAYRAGKATVYLHGRDEAIKNSNYNDTKAKLQQQAVNYVIQDVKKNGGTYGMNLEECAKKYDIDPETLAVGLYQTTGWLMPSDTVSYGNSANRKIQKKKG